MLKKELLILFLVSLIFINGCLKNTTKCVVAGCSSQICTTPEEAKGMFTTCEFREEYNCLKFSNCGYYNGECKWEETEEYLKCLDEVRK